MEDKIQLAAFFDSAALADRAERAFLSMAVLSGVSAVSLVAGQYEASVVSGSMAAVCFFGNRLFKDWQSACLVNGYQPTQRSMDKASYSMQFPRMCGVY